MAPSRKFKHAWLADERFSGWLKEVQGNTQQAYCEVCHKTLAAEITSLKSHKTSAIHSANTAKRAAFLEGSSSNSWTYWNSYNVGNSPVKDKVKNKVTRAKVKLAAYFAEHNIPFNSMGDLIDLSKDIFRDRRVLPSMTVKQSETTRVIKDIGETAKEDIVESLKKNKFSIILHEITNVSTTKVCAVIVKYYDAEYEGTQTRLLDLLDLHTASDNGERSIGEHLFDLIINLLSVHEIPIENLIGFVTDGTSNIMGQHNSLTSRLKKAAPGITIFECACQSINLCVSNAAKTLPRKCEDLLRSIYTYFSHRSKQTTELVEFQEFCNTEPHKLLYASQTQWLSLHMAVACVLKQWQPLTVYFFNKPVEDVLRSSEVICDGLKDQSVHIYFQFLDFILPYFNNFNEQFQQSEPTIHLLYNKCRILYSNLLRCYYMPNKVTDCQLSLIDPSDENNFIPLTEIYLGVNVHKSLQEWNIPANEEMIADIRKVCQQFMVTACVQMKERFSLDSKLLQVSSSFSVANCVRVDALLHTPTLSDLVREVPRIYSGDIQKLDNEWRNIPNVNIPEDIQASSNTEAFFLYLASVKNWEGEAEFEVLPTFALNMLSLPTSSADAGRIFSKMNLIKTKSRNKLSTSTQAALAIVSETIKREGGCLQFEPTAKMIKVVRRNPEKEEKDIREEQDETL